MKDTYIYTHTIKSISADQLQLKHTQETSKMVTILNKSNFFKLKMLLKNDRITNLQSSFKSSF